MKNLDLIDDTVGKDRTARKHIRTIEERINELIALLEISPEPEFGPLASALEKLPPKTSIAHRFTVGTASRNDTANVLPPTDVPPPGTVDDYNPEGDFVKVRDNSESGWAMIKRDFVDEFIAQLNA